MRGRAAMKGVTPRSLAGFYLVGVVVPGPKWVVPPGGRAAQRRVRRWLERASGRWEKRADTTVTDGTRLMVYRNKGRLTPRDEAWRW